jgi:beta-galactosidase GanA
MTLPITGRIPYGGDSNPEQWPEEIWDRDYERLAGSVREAPRRG